MQRSTNNLSFAEIQSLVLQMPVAQQAELVHRLFLGSQELSRQLNHKQRRDSLESLVKAMDGEEMVQTVKLIAKRFAPQRAEWE